MKTNPIDFLLSGVAILLIASSSMIFIVYFFKIFSVPLFDEYHIIADTLAFLFCYGLISALLLKFMLKIQPFTPGNYSMEENFFIRWKLFTVIYEFGRGALLPFTTVFTKPLILKLFGAKIGKDIALGGHLVDPQLIEIGDEAIIGQDSVITAHTINSGYIILKPVHIGAKATIGVHAVLMSGVVVGEGSIITAGSVVTPDTCIPSYELWGGIPAKKIKQIQE